MKHDSKQRRAILQVLQDRYDHPTAAAVYQAVKQTLPHISLGTVYRNLDDLCEAGSVLRLSCEDGAERYDGHTKTHIHLHCRKCGALADVPVGDTLFDGLLAGRHFTPQAVSCVIQGLCETCQKEEMITDHQERS